METRRLLLAFALSLAVVILWGKLFPPEPLPEPTPPAATGESAPPVAPAPVAPTAAPGTEPASPAVGGDAESAPAPVEQISAEAEERLQIETANYRATFTNRGAQLVSFELADQENADGGPVDLVRQRADPPYPFALTDAAGRGSALNEMLYRVDRSSGSDGERVVTFRYAGPEGDVAKRFAFSSNGLFEVDVSVAGSSDWGLFLGPGLRNPPEKELTGRFSQRAAVYSSGDEVERVPAKDDERLEASGVGMRWIGLEDTYFLTALVPSAGLSRVVLQPVLQRPAAEGAPASFAEPTAGSPDAEKELVREMAVVLKPEGDRIVAGAYWGPKQYDRLASYPYGLEETINLGFFRFLALPLLKGLNWIHDRVVGNYGWAIVLMTILIRILLFPLTHKSTVSMQKMQEVNPKIQAIRQKWRSKLKDKQGRPNVEAQRKMNEEVMGVYKTEGINPAGGCLPMLLQLPVFFAFYQLLSAAIELRHTPWMLWIKDLSAPDPFFVLPILMGASQLAQQIMTPTGGDPMQRRIFMLMPIFLTVLFLGFPAGLVLYWLTSNLLGIVQQLAYKRYRERRSPALAAGKSK